MIGGLDDWWLLQIVLVLLYLMECMWWVSPRSVILERTRRGDRFCWPMADVTIRGRVPVLLNPLTPWRQYYVLEPLPLTVTTDAVVLMPMQDPRRRPEPTPTNARLLRWDDIAGIWHEDRRLFVGRGTIITYRSPAIAEQTAFRLRLTWQTNPSERIQLLCEWDAERCDRSRVEAAFLTHTRSTRMLCLGGATMFLSLFVVLPLSITLYTTLVAYVFVLAGAGWLCVLVAYARATQHEAGHRRTLANMMLTPMSAIRAVSHMTRDRLASVEPAAVILAAKATADSDEISGLLLRDLVWPVRCGVAETDRQLDAARVRVLEMLRARFPSFARHVAAPSRDAGCLAYCPRCHLQYVIEQGDCCNCAGVQLQPWPEGAKG